MAVAMAEAVRAAVAVVEVERAEEVWAVVAMAEEARAAVERVVGWLRHLLEGVDRGARVLRREGAPLGRALQPRLEIEIEIDRDSPAARCRDAGSLTTHLSISVYLYLSIYPRL